MIEITFKGAEETRRFLADAPEALQKAVKKALKQTAVLTKEEAIDNCPVRTGALRKSIYYKVSDYSYSVGAKAEYGGYVEFGTRYMEAQPYLRPAFIFVTRTIPSAMGKEIEKEIGRL
jgi:HK97 gp10 family phage protein